LNPGLIGCVKSELEGEEMYPRETQGADLTASWHGVERRKRDMIARGAGEGQS